MLIKVGRKLSILLLLCFVVSAAKCSNSGSSISDAIKATDDLRAGIDAAEKLTTQLGQDKHITPAQEKQINLLLLGVNSATKVFYAQVVQAKQAGKWDANVKASLATAFGDVNVELQKLNTAGIFDISDPASKQRFDLVLKSINAAASLISASLQ